MPLFSLPNMHNPQATPNLSLGRRNVDQILKRQFGIIARRQALASRMSPRSIDRKVSSGGWIPIYRGVYRLAAVQFGWNQRLMAAYLLVGEPAAVSRRAAGGLWKLEGIVPGTVELTTPDFRRRPERDFELHSSDLLPNADLARIGPLVVTTPTRTLIDLGTCVGAEQLEVATEDAFRRRLSSSARMLARLDALSEKGRPGIGPMRELMSKRTSGGARSLLEVKVLRLFREAGLPKPVTQYRVQLGPRSRVEIDVAYPDALLAIEVDGFRFHSEPSAWQKDRSKRNALTKLGWRVIQITWEDITERPQEVVEMVRALLVLPSPAMQ